MHLLIKPHLYTHMIYYIMKWFFFKEGNPYLCNRITIHVCADVVSTFAITFKYEDDRLDSINKILYDTLSHCTW